jgi:hypothetical protein
MHIVTCILFVLSHLDLLCFFKHIASIYLATVAQSDVKGFIKLVYNCKRQDDQVLEKVKYRDKESYWRDDKVPLTGKAENHYNRHDSISVRRQEHKTCVTSAVNGYLSTEDV